MQWSLVGVMIIWVGLAQAWQLMFDSVDTANDCIRIATGVLSTIRINPDRMLAGLSPDMLATDLAEYLVRKGVHSFPSVCSCLPQEVSLYAPAKQH